MVTFRIVVNSSVVTRTCIVVLTERTPEVGCREHIKIRSVFDALLQKVNVSLDRLVISGSFSNCCEQ